MNVFCQSGDLGFVQAHIIRYINLNIYIFILQTYIILLTRGAPFYWLASPQWYFYTHPLVGEG